MIQAARYYFSYEGFPLYTDAEGNQPMLITASGEEKVIPHTAFLQNAIPISFEDYQKILRQLKIHSAL